MQPQVAGHPATKTPTPSHNLFSTCTLPITISHDLTTKSYPRPKARPTWRSQDSARGILYHFFESFHTALHRRWGRDGHKAGFRVRYPADRIGNQGRRTRASGLYHIERDCAPSLARGGRRGARRLGRLNELVVDHLVPPQSQFGGFGGDGKQSVTALVWFGEGWIDLPLRALAGFFSCTISTGNDSSSQGTMCGGKRKNKTRHLRRWWIPILRGRGSGGIWLLTAHAELPSWQNPRRHPLEGICARTGYWSRLLFGALAFSSRGLAAINAILY